MSMIKFILKVLAQKYIVAIQKFISRLLTNCQNFDNSVFYKYSSI